MFSKDGADGIIESKFKIGHDNEANNGFEEFTRTIIDINELKSVLNFFETWEENT